VRVVDRSAWACVLSKRRVPPFLVFIFFFVSFCSAKCSVGAITMGSLLGRGFVCSFSFLMVGD